MNDNGLFSLRDPRLTKKTRLLEILKNHGVILPLRTPHNEVIRQFLKTQKEKTKKKKDPKIQKILRDEDFVNSILISLPEVDPQSKQINETLNKIKRNKKHKQKKEKTKKKINPTIFADNDSNTKKRNFDQLDEFSEPNSGFEEKNMNLNPIQTTDNTHHGKQRRTNKQNKKSDNNTNNNSLNSAQNLENNSSGDSSNETIEISSDEMETNSQPTIEIFPNNKSPYEETEEGSNHSTIGDNSHQNISILQNEQKIDVHAYGQDASDYDAQEEIDSGNEEEEQLEQTFVIDLDSHQQNFVRIPAPNHQNDQTTNAWKKFWKTNPGLLLFFLLLFFLSTQIIGRFMKIIFK
ncbi:26s proteasome non-atpase regulatory subunit 4 [Anaeramoeba flamelloides]|uniref:26s proteasome non-atpase regulatory subunit 4 n=1 Tax=Anaeramoeba flamelloides TaxID=1746091 RepID=A0AAV7Z3T4_9EUKA|nr:26s proteasome non-atpase regulatory subunit 4 [Anaeramoeba flamelloides]